MAKSKELKIQYKNYTLTPIVPGQYDLTKTIQRQAIGEGTKKEPAGELYDMDVPVAYATTFGKCVEYIIRDEVAKENDVTDLENYLKEYERISQLTINHFKK